MIARTGDMGMNAPGLPRILATEVSVKEGGGQIEYEDDDREIHQIFEKDLKAHGATCKMKAFIRWCTGKVGPMSERDT